MTTAGSEERHCILHVNKASVRLCGPHLVDTQSPKGQRFTGVGVNEEDFSIQYHAVSSRERLRDELFEVSHLKQTDAVRTASGC